MLKVADCKSSRSKVMFDKNRNSEERVLTRNSSLIKYLALVTLGSSTGSGVAAHFKKVKNKKKRLSCHRNYFCLDSQEG